MTTITNEYKYWWVTTLEQHYQSRSSSDAYQAVTCRTGATEDIFHLGSVCWHSYILHLSTVPFNVQSEKCKFAPLIGGRFLSRGQGLDMRPTQLTHPSPLSSTPAVTRGATHSLMSALDFNFVTAHKCTDVHSEKSAQVPSQFPENCLKVQVLASGWAWLGQFGKILREECDGSYWHSDTTLSRTPDVFVSLYSTKLWMAFATTIFLIYIIRII